jgi:hypothetical protein
MADEKVKTTTETTTEHEPGSAPDPSKTTVEKTETTKTTEETPGGDRPVTTETQTKTF